MKLFKFDCPVCGEKLMTIPKQRSWYLTLCVYCNKICIQTVEIWEVEKKIEEIKDRLKDRA